MVVDTVCTYCGVGCDISFKLDDGLKTPGIKENGKSFLRKDIQKDFISQACVY